MTEVLKGSKFVWTSQAQRSFEELKEKLTQAPVLALLCFDKIFEEECDASGVGISGVLTQDGKLIAYFSEKLSEGEGILLTTRNCLLSSVPLLIANELILHSDHEALKYIEGQHKLNSRHAKWVEYLQSFHFVIKHKSEKLNQGVDALSRRHLLLFQLGACMLGFELLKSVYKDDQDFKELYESCQAHPKGEFSIQEGYLFKGNRLCVPRCGTREPLLEKSMEVHLPITLEKTRCTLWSKSTTFGLTCSRTFKTLSKDVPLVKWPKAMYFLKGFTLHCLLHKDHG